MFHLFIIYLLHQLAIVSFLILFDSNLQKSYLAIRVNNIITQDILSQRMFNTDVTSLKWFPSVVC